MDAPEEQPSANGHGHATGFAVENPERDPEVQTADTRRAPQVAPEFLGGGSGGASQSRVAHEEGADEFGDAPLDLGDFSGGKAFACDDPFLDVLDETVAHEEFFIEATPNRAAPAEESSDAVAPVPAFEETKHWSPASENPPPPTPTPPNLPDLSPDPLTTITH